MVTDDPAPVINDVPVEPESTPVLKLGYASSTPSMTICPPFSTIKSPSPERPIERFAPSSTPPVALMLSTLFEMMFRKPPSMDNRPKPVLSVPTETCDPT